MYYSTLAARSLIKISRSIGQGCLFFGVLAGFHLIQTPTFALALIFIMTPFLIGKKCPLQPVFRFLNQRICKNYVLKIYRRLGVFWIFWGACYLLKIFIFATDKIAIYQFYTLSDALLIFSFLTLIALTLLKVFLYLMNNKVCNDTSASNKAQKNRN